MTSVPSTLPRSTSRRGRIAVASTSLVAVSTFGLLAGLTGTAQAATRIDLGTAEDFVVLAGAGITNIPTTVVSGDMGSAPTEASHSGVDHLQGDDLTAAEVTDLGAKTALTDAMTAAENAPATGTVAAGTLGGRLLGPGVYNSGGATLDLTGTLTLDGGGSYDSVFVFQATSDLITAGSSAVVLTGGAQACNVYWQVSSSATLGGSSTFAGTILAQTAITLGNLATVDGRVLASTAAVSLSQNTITRPDTCLTGPVTPVVDAPPTTTPPATTPPATTPPATTPPTTTPTAGPTATPTPTAVPTGAVPAGTSDGADTPVSAAAPGTVPDAGRTTYDQVGRVPVGSVDTGDGSTS